MKVCRWKRLEKYAQYKMGKFRLLSLPDDVFTYMCLNFLFPNDLCALFESIVGGYVTKQHLLSVGLPLTVKVRWILYTAIKDIEYFLYSIADKCLFMSTMSSHVHAFIDWSPFKRMGLLCSPVAEYSWSAQVPHGRVNINHVSLIQAIAASFNRQRPSGYLAVYTCNTDSWGAVSMSARPTFSTQVSLLPWWIMRDSIGDIEFNDAIKREVRALCCETWYQNYTSVN